MDDDDTSIRIAALHAALDCIDYYSLLGVSRGCGPDELRDAYYRFALDLHPDNFREAEPALRARVHSIFKRAAEGYRVLGDPRLRQTYEEGLTEGSHRLRSEEQSRASSIAAEPTFQSLGARQFWRQGLEAESAGELKRARLSIKMVLGLEPDNGAARTKLEEIETRMKETRK